MMALMWTLSVLPELIKAVTKVLITPLRRNQHTNQQNTKVCMKVEGVVNEQFCTVLS